ncbi:hypothetical protein GTP46_03105 [Duganella sp. FT135W]|uniref:Dienelactone hydrolase domain-containing protein n=1 Tax=Duganella flavida TaxID=2692175 RepID=A0A6L8K2H5_9BURK|nr:dienelactone hydrolase family protein [Duganella flavida]MYM21636.1 hypothetical protein [Duganella flavida]
MGDSVSAGLTAGTIQINVNGHELQVYCAQPEGKTRPPVVLVISEVAGAHEQVAEVVRRFARQGYLALAPELFSRRGDVVFRAPDAQVFAELDAVVTWAQANGGNGDKISITGFCWGGRIAWLYAVHNPAIKTGVAWYGGLAGDASVNFPRHPVHAAGAVSAPMDGWNRVLGWFKQAEVV